VLLRVIPKLMCPACADENGTLAPQVFDADPADHIRAGVVICTGCRAWYPIQDGILELVRPELLDGEAFAAFVSRFGGHLTGVGLTVAAAHPGGAPAADVSAQLEQRQHFDWYAENPTQDYSDYARSPFWCAVDDVTFEAWTGRVRREDWLLDIGCANGRSSFPYAGRCHVVGFDISRKMVLQAAKRAEALGCQSTMTFMVADGHRLPFRPKSFEFAQTYGVLHHLPDPSRTSKQIAHLLKDGGVFFASENNESLFRGLFDLSMRLCPLWTEKAGREPLITRSMAAGWFRDTGCEIRWTTRVFLSPHLLNLCGAAGARWLLRCSDVLRHLPLLGGHGGLILFEVTRGVPLNQTASAVSAQAAVGPENSP
jgi:SAM-dependent methyltransferase/uncharacterized protein YbaR (Trm112 family)